MRMRRKKNLSARLESCTDLVFCTLFEYNAPKQILAANKEKQFFQQITALRPVHLEIGCGKGGFINTLAAENPNIAFFALEKSRNVIVTAMEKTLEVKTDNLKYIIGLADYLERVIPENTVDVIYLNFSCPYPKNSYANRRLTHERYLKIYRRILKPGGVIKQKTDNLPFFEYSLKSILLNNFTVSNVTYDLHNSDVKGNIMTEYEEFFSNKGIKINYLEALVKK